MNFRLRPVIKYSTGTKISVNSVDVVKPPITVMANPTEIKLVVECVNANGISAKMV